jgi:hypothetical protein
MSEHWVSPEVLESIDFCSLFVGVTGMFKCPGILSKFDISSLELQSQVTEDIRHVSALNPSLSSSERAPQISIPAAGGGTKGSLDSAPYVDLRTPSRATIKWVTSKSVKQRQYGLYCAR